MTINIEELNRDMDAGTPGPWEAPIDFMDFGWSLDTDEENSCIGIGHSGGPLLVHCVERAFGLDDLQNADARRIARLPDLEQGYLNMTARAEAAEDREAKMREVLVLIADRAASAAAYDNDKYNFGWMVDRARAVLKDGEDR